MEHVFCWRLSLNLQTVTVNPVLCQKQTTRTDYVSSKPVVTQMPPAPTPPPPAPARLPTPPLPPPAPEPAKPAASSSTVNRQDSVTSSDNGSVAMRDHSNQRPAPFNRESSQTF